MAAAVEVEQPFTFFGQMESDFGRLQISGVGVGAGGQNNTTVSVQDQQQSLLQRYSEENILQAHVMVPPHALRYNLRHVIQDRLAKSIRNRCTEKDGFVLQMKRILEPIEDDILDRRTGAVHYTVNYVAQTLNPRVGDVVEAVVSMVSTIGVFAELGPLNIFLPRHRMSEEFEFQTVPVAHYTREGAPEQTIRVGSEVQVKIERIAMLDDNFMPSNSTSTVLKAMGELLGVQASVRSQTRPSYASVLTSQTSTRATTN